MRYPRIPFQPKFADPIRSGRKTTTARTRRYGEPGFRLRTSFGFDIVITAVQKTPLAVVRDLYWKQEGVDSPEEFEAVWNSLHPRKGFDSEQEVWLHHFHVLEPPARLGEQVNP